MRLSAVLTHDEKRLLEQGVPATVLLTARQGGKTLSFEAYAAKTLALELDRPGHLQARLEDRQWVFEEIPEGTVKLTRIVRDDPFDVGLLLTCQHAHVASFHTRKERVLNNRW